MTGKPPAMPAEGLRKGAQRLASAALEALAAIMQGEGQDSVKLAAAREVLDRGYGRPKLGEPEAAARGGMTVIVKRFSDVTAKDEAEADETEARLG
jgi:hypothetical protein